MTLPYDTLLISNLIQRERAARDAGLWSEMCACWHPQSHVDVSWFQGSGMDFTTASESAARAGQTLSFHQMGSSVVTVRGDRALVDTGCAVHAMRQLGQSEVVVIRHKRLLSRDLRQGDDWLIAGLRMIYIRDLLVPRDPTCVPVLDQSVLRSFRESYRYLSFILTQSGRAPRMDLPGVDQPESVVALRTKERQWLEEDSSLNRNTRSELP